jgi:heat-inducible transcriptional repressor
VEFVRIEPTRALVVLVGEAGSVENRIIDIPRGLPTSALTEATNYLNAHFRGRTLADARRELERLSQERRRELDRLAEKVVAAGLATWSGSPAEASTLIVRGRSHLLEDLRQSEDLERIRLLFDDLETKTDIIQLLGLAEQGEHVQCRVDAQDVGA